MRLLITTIMGGRPPCPSPSLRDKVAATAAATAAAAKGPAAPAARPAVKSRTDAAARQFCLEAKLFRTSLFLDRTPPRRAVERRALGVRPAASPLAVGMFATP